MNTYVDIHIIQSVPPSCVNRDDSGSPKSAVYGGVRRLRVSSQSWKRATRLHFADHLTTEHLGIRTKRVVEVLANEIRLQAPELTETADTLAEGVFKAAKIKLSAAQGRKDAPQESGYLLFLSQSQVSRLASLVIASTRSGDSLDAKKVKEIFKEDHAVDVSLFGRMVADDADLNVDAACQVAHAISTHAAENEYDFFTAVDDAKASSDEEDAGAGMMGTVEFSSATLYRYATVNVVMLRKNLGTTRATLQALEAFIDGFCLSMPTGKQNTFANRTLPDTILVTIRQGQPISLVDAFEKPIAADATLGYLNRSVQALAKQAVILEESYGLKSLRKLVVSMQNPEIADSLGERISFTDLASRVRETVEPLLPEQEQD